MADASTPHTNAATDDSANVPAHVSAQEIANLQASLERAQAEIAAMKSQSAQVPASTLQSASGNTESPGNTDTAMADPELQALSLDWGDFDPQLVKQMLQDPSLKQAFIAAHTSARGYSECRGSTTGQT